MKFTGNIPSTKHVGLDNNFQKINEIGLRKAYHSDNKVYVDGDAMFIAGSSNKQDRIDHFTKILFNGDVRQSQRYTDVIETVKKTQTLIKSLDTAWAVRLH